MVKVLFTDLVVMGEKEIARMAASYGNLPDALVAADPRVLKAALRLAAGNPRCLTAEEDGSIIVWNYPVW